jgi:glycosyltransferase involved in cell wall biosynthesis
MRASRRPRIGIDVTAAIAQGGGIGRYTRELVRAVVSLANQYDYHLFSAKPPLVGPVPDPLPVGSNVSYHPAPLREQWLYRLWHRFNLPLPVQWVTGRLELFHSPDFVLPPVAGGIPTLLTVHDLSFVHFPETFPAALVNYLNTVVPRSIRRATHILADSVATQNDLIDIWQVAAEKITVLHSGVGEAFRPVNEPERMETVRQKYALGDVPYILSVGTIQPRKNHQMLIRAFQPIASQWPHNLIIAGGKGWLYEDMLAEVTKQGLDERVRFLGFVEDADLAALYTGAALFVFPSLYEGFGLPLLEAMACGVPVITSNASSLPELVKGDPDHESAVQISPHEENSWTEAMNTLLADPSRRTRLVADGFRQSRRFSWHKAAQTLQAVYQQLLALE